MVAGVDLGRVNKHSTGETLPHANESCRFRTSRRPTIPAVSINALRALLVARESVAQAFLPVHLLNHS